MPMRTTLASLFSLIVASAAALGASAAVIAPAKTYVKPDEPLTVRFLAEKGDEGKKAVETLGLDAAKMDAWFTPAAPTDVVAADGSPVFKAFDAVTGAALKPAVETAGPDAGVDVAKYYPQLKDPGTYYLTWKDSAPLVVETLRNPVPWGYAKSGALPAAEQQNMIRQFTTGAPVITHLVAAEIVVFTTDKGVIKAKFSYDAAPHTIDNFVDLARHGMYDNSAFHRILKGFMIQGGDSLANDASRAGSGGPGFDVAAEISEKKHEKGTLSMARMGFSLDTAGSQFFIMHDKTPSLDGEYTAFGDVFEGLDVVDAIAATKSEKGTGAVAPADRPKIVSVKILPGTAEIYGIKK